MMEWYHAIQLALLFGIKARVIQDEKWGRLFTLTDSAAAIVFWIYGIVLYVGKL